MPGLLTIAELTKAVEAGEIDTVIMALVDMQGRLMGKRFHAQHFLDSAVNETHCCNYLLADDLEMAPVPGFKSASWETGYGDYMMKPDLATCAGCRGWKARHWCCAMCMDHHSHEDIPASPRAMLKKQIARLEAMGLSAMMATELEFFLFEESFEEAHAQGYRDLNLISGYNEDYHLFQTTKEEDVMRAVRNGLYGAGIPVESSKGEAEAGQEEMNIKYADALTAADNHVIAKNAVKEIAWAAGPGRHLPGQMDTMKLPGHPRMCTSRCGKDGRQARFHDPDGEYGMSELMRQYLAGLLAHAPEFTFFLAPYINSYKRFQAGTFAPTKAIWSVDNRTAGFRSAAVAKAVRVECRIGGSDLNPYLASRPSWRPAFRYRGTR